jgi:ABC-type sugar transport system ATPase subunit
MSLSASKSNSPFVNALELAGVRKSYDEFVAVDDLSLAIKPGTIYGLLGRTELVRPVPCA